MGKRAVDSILMIEEGSLVRTKALDLDKLDSMREELMVAAVVDDGAATTITDHNHALTRSTMNKHSISNRSLPTEKDDE